MAQAHLFCWDCTAHAVVPKVASNMRCRCGSSDIDLYDPEHEGQRQRIAHVASLRAPQKPVDFVSFMTKQATAPVGTEIPGWDVYKGPMPGANPMQNSDDPHMQAKRCPVCKGSGYDLHDHNTCRECGGTGFMTPTTTPEPPAVARHNYPSTQTTVPFMGKKTSAKPSVNTEQSRAVRTPNGWTPMDYTHKQESPLVLRGAKCPTCAAPNTHLVTAANEHGWWSCPNCGPLADIDRHPDIDPYNPPSGFKPKPRSFKAASKDSSPARIMSMAASIAEQNPGLNQREILGLARQTARRYPEAQ